MKLLFILVSIILGISAKDIQLKNSEFLTNEVEETNVIDLDKIQPSAPYLQGWAKTFTELGEVPLCKDVPMKSDEEALIETKCPEKGAAPTICLNIRLFGVIRNMCFTEYEQNQDKWIKVMDNIVSEQGLSKFISETTDLQIFQRVEQETGMKLNNFQKRNFRDLWLSHIVDLIKASTGQN